jgi:peptidoglycan-N-acetylglucosamine deacetylase
LTLIAIYPIKTPRIFKFFYPKAIWNIKSNKKVIYLTFDDGPIPGVTEEVLRVLKEYGVKASFFCIGDNIQKFPEVFQQIKDQGHLIGNHTFHHVKGWSTSSQDYIENVAQCDELVKSRFFRPPYGRITFKQSKVLQAKGYQLVMWDVLSGDFDSTLSPQGCLNGVLKYTRPGSVVVFHDSIKAEKNMLYTLPRAIKYWKMQGYEFKTLEELS